MGMGMGRGDVGREGSMSGLRMCVVKDNKKEREEVGRGGGSIRLCMHS